MSGRWRTASPRCSAAAMRADVRCRCRPRSCSNRQCSSTCKAWVFRKKHEAPLTPSGRKPNVNVVNIYIVNETAQGEAHVRGNGQTGRPAEAGADRPGDHRLHRLLADRAGSACLHDMEWTHVLRKTWPLWPLVQP